MLIYSLNELKVSEDPAAERTGSSRSNIIQKVKEATVIAERVISSIRNNESAKTGSVEILLRDNKSQNKIVDATFLHKKKDSFSRLLNSKGGLHLSQHEAKDLAAILLGSFRDAGFGATLTEQEIVSKKCESSKHKLNLLSRLINDITREKETLHYQNKLLIAK